MSLRIYKLFPAVISIVIILGLAACHTARKGQSLNGTTDLSVPEKNTPEQKVRNLVSEVQNWHDISLPVKCKIRVPKNFSISGRASMIRGSEISLSLRMLGFEVAGMYATNDSIFVFEKLNKTLIAESLSKITDATGLNLTDIQDILTGRLCYPGTEISDKNIFELFSISLLEDNVVSLLPANGQPWCFTLSNQEPMSLKSLDINIPEKLSATCIYEQFNPVINGFCKSATINAEAGKQKLDATIEWSLGEAKVDNNLKPQKPSLKGYRRISFAQLIKILGNV